jgi:hypothetical protein
MTMMFHMLGPTMEARKIAKTIAGQREPGVGDGA